MLGRLIEELERMLGRFLIGLGIAILGGLIGYFGVPALKKLGLL
jgi:hypothetical protein